MEKIIQIIRCYVWEIAVFFFALLAGWALLHPGLYPTHDGEYHVIRFYEFYKTIQMGSWYPRWAPDLNFGYGVPLFTYVYPLPNFTAALFHFLGASFIDSFKLISLTSILIGALFMYFWSREFWGEKGAFVAAIFYTFSPYHFVDVYIRGSIGEVMALGFFPAFLWAYTRSVKTHQTRFVIYATFFLTLIIFSHNILALMFFLFALSYMALFVLQEKKKKLVLIHSLLVVFFALGLSCIFWLPALSETHYIVGLQIFDTTRNFADFYQLLFPSWGSGFFDSNLADQMSIQIGIANLLSFAIALFVGWKLFQKKDARIQIVIYSLVWFMVLFFLMLRVSLPIWQYAPLIHYFQFPWRFLSLEILVAAFLAGSIFSYKKSIFLVILLVGLCLLTTYDYAHPAYYMLRNDHYYTSRSNFIDGTNSPGNSFNTLWESQPTKRAKDFILSGSLTSATVKRISSSYVIKMQTKQTKSIRFALTYFPTWEVTIDGKKVKTFPQHGYLAIDVAPGTHTIEISHQETPLELIAKLVTLGTILCLCLYCIKRSKNQRNTLIQFLQKRSIVTA